LPCMQQVETWLSLLQMQDGKHPAPAQLRLTPSVMLARYNTSTQNGSVLATTVAYLLNQTS